MTDQQLIAQLLGALRAVDEESRLRSLQRGHALHRPKGSTGIAVDKDEHALKWQKIAERLAELQRNREEALAAAEAQPAGEAVALDAARFRFVVENGWPSGERQIHPTVEDPFWFYGDNASVAEHYSSPVEAIDAAMLAAPQPKGAPSEDQP